jgi:hypothetical protein
MILREQLLAALYGVWQVLKLDACAFDFFEKTPGGFARSFLPALVVSPLHLLHEVLVYDAARSKLAFAPYLVVQILSDVLSWTLFPFAMIYVARLLARETRYFWYMVPYNWFQLPLGLALFPIILLADVGIVSMQMAAFVNLVVLTLFFTFGSFMARVGLQVGLGSAIGIVVVDLMLTVFTNQMISRI